MTVSNETPEVLETNGRSALIIRKGELTPLWHLRASLNALEEALDESDSDIGVKILTLEPGSAIEIPPGYSSSTSDIENHGGLLTWERCPPGGVILLPN